MSTADYPALEDRVAALEAGLRALEAAAAPAGADGYFPSAYTVGPNGELLEIRSTNYVAPGEQDAGGLFGPVGFRLGADGSIVSQALTANTIQLVDGAEQAGRLQGVTRMPEVPAASTPGPDLFISNDAGRVQVAPAGEVVVHGAAYLSEPRICAFWSWANPNVAQVTIPTGGFQVIGASWSSVSAPARVGYEREYRLRMAATYLPAAGTTASNGTLRLNQDPAVLCGGVPPGPANVAQEFNAVGDWTASAALDLASGVYLQGSANWATAVGAYNVYAVALEVRYLKA